MAEPSRGPASSKPDVRKVRSGEDFDILIGFLGFWALVLFVVTVFKELTGKPALLPAMILLGLAIVACLITLLVSAPPHAPAPLDSCVPPPACRGRISAIR